jgi:hypothetical protein
MQIACTIAAQASDFISIHQEALGFPSSVDPSCEPDD